MIEQTFSATRCRDTRKPREGECPGVCFYRCEVCGALFPVSQENAGDSLVVTYRITGGYNDNAVKVSWKAKLPEDNPEWIYLKTFTGGYLKYIAEGKRPPMVFALADTDAFAYCDEDPCLECVFRCKRGFILYVYGKKTGLLEVPLDKMNAQWQSKAKP